MVLSKTETYQGKLKVDFRLNDKNEDALFLDFHGKAISDLTINNQFIDPNSVTFDKHKI